MKILYIYDIDGWAIHKVGKLWLSGQDHEVVLKKFTDVSSEDVDRADYVWYGFTRLYFKTVQAALGKTIVSIHDPSEIAAPHRGWRKFPVPNTLQPAFWHNFLTRYLVRRKNIGLLRNAARVVVTSKELEEVLLARKIRCARINTTTDLPTRKDVPAQGQLKVISVANRHVRKDFKLLGRIGRFCESRGVPFYLKGGNVSSEEDYVRLMDQYSIYVCTSTQEGGPLPAMDAMARGLIVLTTPVGQIQEIVDGTNGFICRSYRDFVGKLEHLASLASVERAVLSRNAIASIEKRSPREISRDVRSFMEKL